MAKPIEEWEKPVWIPEPLFRGETVFCLAPGPSLTADVVEKVRGRRCIAVNNAGYNALFADVLFFTDAGWFEQYNDSNNEHRRPKELSGHPGNDTWPRRKFVEQWPGLVVTFARIAKRVLDDPSNPYPMARKPRVNRIEACGPMTQPRRAGPKSYEAGFPPVGSSKVWSGRNSGQTAISLAIAMGAKRVCLVGYDMRLIDGREHNHATYALNRDLTLYEKEFVPAFSGWNEAAIASGVEVLNCTPGSALTEFPSDDLDEVLNGIGRDSHDRAGSYAAHYA